MDAPGLYIASGLRPGVNQVRLDRPAAPLDNESVTLLEGERVIDQLGSCGLVLTTHRIREGTERDFTSIMLEQICSVAIGRVGNTWLLVIGVAVIVAATVTGEYQKIDFNSAVALGLLGLVIIAAYFVTRRSVIQIASARASIFVRVPRRKPASGLRLVDAIEFAKSERMRVLAESRWERAS
jgi:hypothetical protein